MGSLNYLSGSFIDLNPASPLVAGSDPEFRSFNLSFDTISTAGKLDMQGRQFHLASGNFTIKNGTLRTSILTCDSSTEFNCPRVRSCSGSATVKSMLKTADVTFDSNVVIDSGTTVLNLAYTDAILTVKGDFTNNGLTRRGPGYAAYGEGNLALCIRGNFRQNGTYTVQNTHFTGDVEQTIGTEAGKVIEGLYYDDNPGSHLRATTDLVFTGAKFVVSPDTIRKGYFAMDTFRLYHSSGNFQVDSGTLQADYITGGEDGNAVFTIRTIDTKSGSVSISKHFSTSSCAIHDTLVIKENGIVYNQEYVIAVITTRGTNIKGKIGSGPGYASYDDGYVILDGLKLEQWR